MGIRRDAEGNNQFTGWAEVSLMGHAVLWGYVRTDYFGNDSYFVVRTEEIPEREVVLESVTPHSPEFLGVGSRVKKSAVPSHTTMVSGHAIYSIRECTQVECEMAASEQSRIIEVLEQAPIPADYLPF